ncbi:MarR family winged helix-turn-helix transcriptional regulator [Aliiroseovarius sp. 2305UL8-7]|uniref:MarR family winged helix-turn-helix transcriptional regulator n=1 Tax=Aliiroseovarius conchicola TaxID=3121637 RepID=UPI003529AC6A
MNDTDLTVPLELQSFAPYLLNRIVHRYNQTLQSKLKEAGLTVTKMRVIASLAVFEKLSVNELCVHAISEQSTMSRAIEKMEEQGLVTRFVPDDDQRSRVITLTAEGRRVYNDIRPVMDQANAYLLRALSEDEQDMFFKLNQKILKQLREHPI